LRCPPSLTPFPFTTLFRSRATAGGAFFGYVVSPTGIHSSLRVATFHFGIQRYLDSPFLTRRAFGHRVIQAIARSKAVHQLLEIRDRKSTRLNSSHQIISYA